MFYSTRNFNNKVKASQAILQGLASDGGLFLPSEIKEYKVNKDNLTKSYQEICFDILSLYLDDFTPEDIKECISKAYSKENFNKDIISLFNKDKFSILELFNGPTITFKDMALSLLPHLMVKANEIAKNKKKLMILTATSGDTGSAALNGFSKNQDIAINVFYPEGGISPIQEKQMLYFSTSNSRAYSLKNSNFDDCQNAVKKILNEGNDNYQLTSANSINIGRLLPQIVYYYKAYIDLVNSGVIRLEEKIDVVVPSGNFGNILSCYLAKRMGLPVNKIVCSSNENRVLTDFFNTYKYSLKREFKLTNSPSMDILISSNFERILSLCLNDDNKVKSCMQKLKEDQEYIIEEKYHPFFKDFLAESITEEETILYMKKCFEENDYMLDPHSAVAYACYEKLKNKLNDHVLIVATASPFKFSKTVLQVFNEKEEDDFKALKRVSTLIKKEIPPQLLKLINHNFIKCSINKKEIKDIVFKKDKFKISTPATSANLSVGFDVLGVAFNIYNEFEFEKADEDRLIGFKGDSDYNLVLTSYKYLFDKLNKTYQPIKITQLKNGIPISRGLGSSASCIIAGLKAANHILKDILSDDDLLRYAIELEGHPDNVVPCLKGSLYSSLKIEDRYVFHSYEVNPKLRFFIGISNQKLSTKKARMVLPDSISREEHVKDIARAISLPSALKEGDLDLLFECLKDNIHTKYRLPLIIDGEKVFEFGKENKIPTLISGSGSTLLLIAKEDITNKLNSLNTAFTFKEVCIDNEGTKLEELRDEK